MNNYVFSVTPTFTQGLILGQLSILALLYLVLKYLFVEAKGQETEHAVPSGYSLPTKPKTRLISSDSEESLEKEWGGRKHGRELETAEWFNLIIQQVTAVYRSRLRDDREGVDGDEIARRRIEQFANSIRPETFLDPIKVLRVDLGTSAPSIVNVRTRTQDSTAPVNQSELEMTYTDSVSVSISTCVLFNYPFPCFARIPISLTISLALFASTILLTAPDPSAENPTLNLAFLPDFTLDLTMNSDVGSRAKLSDVPKLHELIEAQIRRAIIDRGNWKVVLPGISTVEEVKKEELGESDN